MPQLPLDVSLLQECGADARSGDLRIVHGKVNAPCLESLIRRLLPRPLAQHLVRAEYAEEAGGDFAEQHVVNSHLAENQGEPEARHHTHAHDGAAEPSVIKLVLPEEDLIVPMDLISAAKEVHGQLLICLLLNPREQGSAAIGRTAEIEPQYGVLHVQQLVTSSSFTSGLWLSGFHWSANWHRTIPSSGPSTGSPLARGGCSESGGGGRHWQQANASLAPSSNTMPEATWLMRRAASPQYMSGTLHNFFSFVRSSMASVPHSGRLSASNRQPPRSNVLCCSPRSAAGRAAAAARAALGMAPGVAPGAR
eukprot:CAMPEP_0195079834 /NCGR_PEP_ID=MMETSP0448-20130528/21679_1 /TAXON_ID=66468 /ORGANISM="Heterocapsa triquestra, Strain CCMP 448" /LENGTH=307 /DNA_ID=CAMNT_0040112719 /DNA_START=32 /DNA_END=956 /DNA_ORIENTATION=-